MVDRTNQPLFDSLQSYLWFLISLEYNNYIDLKINPIHIHRVNSISKMLISQIKYTLTF